MGAEVIIGAPTAAVVNMATHIEAQRGSRHVFDCVTNTNTYRSHEAEKSKRLWDIGYCIIYDAYDLALAEQLEIPVHHFSTGPGSLYIIYKDGKSTHEWRHEEQTWIRGEDYQAIQCMKGVIQHEQITTGIVTITYEPSQAEVRALYGWRSAAHYAQVPQEPLDFRFRPSRTDDSTFAPLVWGGTVGTAGKNWNARDSPLL